MRVLPVTALCSWLFLTGCVQTVPEFPLSAQQQDALQAVLDEVADTLDASRLRPQRGLVETALALKEEEIADLLTKEQYVRYDRDYRSHLVDRLLQEWRSP